MEEQSYFDFYLILNCMNTIAKYYSNVLLLRILDKSLDVLFYSFILVCVYAVSGIELKAFLMLG